MPNIKLRDGSGVETTYNGITSISVPLADGSGMVSYGLSSLIYPQMYANDYWGQNCMPYVEYLGGVAEVANAPIRRGFTLLTNTNIPAGLTINFNITGGNTDSAAVSRMFERAVDTHGDITLQNAHLACGQLSYLFRYMVPYNNSVDYILQQISSITDAAYYTETGTTVTSGSNVNFDNCIASTSVQSIDFGILQNKIKSNLSYASFGQWVSNAQQLESVIYPVLATETTTNRLDANAIGSNLLMLGTIKFHTNNSTPHTVSWKNMSLGLANGSSARAIGCMIDSYSTQLPETYVNVYDDDPTTMASNYNSVKNTSTKWYARGTGTTTFTVDGVNQTIKLARGYSHYNHSSAVETINSLPDASDYLATAGGTNTITFHPASGCLTDEGGCYELTAAEIAVAADKGWTVSFSTWAN